MRRSLAALLTAFALLMTPLAVAGAVAADEELTDTQKLSPYVSPSMVYIWTTWSGKIYDKNYGVYIRDEPFSATGGCSGFVLTEDGYIGTAAHCVETTQDVKNSILINGLDWILDNLADTYGVDFWANEDEMYDYVARYWAIDGEKVGKPDRSVDVGWGADVSGIDAQEHRPARIIASQKFTTGDTALLKVEASGLNAIPLAEGEELETGTEIASVGYPASVEAVTDPDYTPSIKTGTVSSKKTVDNGLLSVYEIDAAVSPGMSGGPTVNLDGEVVGINSFGITDEPQAFNFVQPVSHLIELLNGAGVTAELSETTQQYRAGLDAYFAGDKEAAVTNLQAVVDAQPANGYARDYLIKAKDLPDPEPEKTKSEDDSNVLTYAIIAILVAALILAGVMIWRRNRKTTVTSPESPSTTPTAVTGVVTPPAGKCGYCGSQNTEGSKFCANCGSSL